MVEEKELREKTDPRRDIVEPDNSLALARKSATITDEQKAFALSLIGQHQQIILKHKQIVEKNQQAILMNQRLIDDIKNEFGLKS